MSGSKRVGIYIRVSTQDQDTNLQRTDLERYSQARGFLVSFVYEDKATGTNSARPQFQAMLKAARERRFDILLVWKLDRFARSLRDLLTHLQELDGLGVEFISLKDNIDLSTPAGRLMVHLLGSFAEFEACLIRERVRAGVSNAKRRGVKFGRPRKIDHLKVDFLRRQGLSLSTIAKQLNTTKSAVSKVLRKAKGESTVIPGLDVTKQ